VRKHLIKTQTNIVHLTEHDILWSYLFSTNISLLWSEHCTAWYYSSGRSWMFV